MEFIETPLAGCYVVKPKKVEDMRGHFARMFCVDEFTQHGLNPAMLQVNTGYSHKAGTIRGLHFQRSPHAEVKFARCTRGAIFDVAVDLREGSTTRGRWFGLTLNADEGTMLYVPEGFAHGYQALSDGAEMYYMTTARYAPSSASGVRWDDPRLAIEWPLAPTVISDPDRQWPDFI